MDWEIKLKERYAISVRREWLQRVLEQLRAAHQDLATWPEARVFEKLFTAYLFCDLNQAGAAALPPNTEALHKVVLQGKFVLQIDEVINMAAAARDRYTDQTGNRCLKLALTDGCQQVVAIEHCHIPAITWDCPAGSKLLIHNVPMRRGLLLLGPDNTALLGGQVERLEAARQRAVAAWNKPVMGRPANAGPRDIFGEARQAAWAPGPPPAQHQQQQQQQQQHPPQAGLPLATAPGQAAARAAAPAAGAQAPGAYPLGGFGAGAAPAPGAVPGQMPPQQQHHPQQQQQAWHGQAQPQQALRGNPQQPVAPRQLQPQQPYQQPPQQPYQHPQANGGHTWGAAGQAAAPQQQPATAAQHGGPVAGQHQWNQQPSTQPRAPTPPTQPVTQQPANAPPDAPIATNASGLSAGAGVAGGGQGSGPRGPAGLQAAQARPGAPSLSNAAAEPGWNGDPGAGLSGGGGTGHAGAGVRRNGQPDGSRANPVELATSSDSASDSPHRSSHDGSTPRFLPAQGQPQHQQQPGLRPPLGPAAAGARSGSAGAAGVGMLGGSARPPAAPQPPAAAAGGALAAAALAASTSSCGLLPPNGRAAAAVQQRPMGQVAPSAAASPAVSGTAGLRKPALPLARSSPGVSHGPSSSAASSGARPAAAAGGAAEAGMNGARQAVGGQPRSSSGRGAVPPPRVMDVDPEVVDLASLDDDDEYDSGVCAAPHAAPAANAPTAPKAEAAADPWVRQHGHKAKLPLPHDPPGGAEKRLRLSPSPEPQRSGGGTGSGGLAAAGAHGPGWGRVTQEDPGPGGGAGAAAPALALAGAAAVDMVPPTQMDTDLAYADGQGEFPAADAEPWAEEPEPWHMDEAGVAEGHEVAEPMAVEATPLGSEGALSNGWPGPAEAGGGGHAVHAPAPHHAGLPQPQHMGSMMLVQVPELLAELRNDLELGLGGGGGGGPFPLTLDVFGVFQAVEGDEALIEDGTCVLRAVLTDAAAMPLLAGALPPAGVGIGMPQSLEEIQALADDPDPAVQDYGQSLAVRLMDQIQDFSGFIRLQYDGPDVETPLIVQLRNEGGGQAGGAGAGPEGGGGGPAGGGGRATGDAQGTGGGDGGCALYEQYLRDVQMVGAEGDMET